MLLHDGELNVQLIDFVVIGAYWIRLSTLELIRAMEFSELRKAIRERYYPIDSKSSPLFLLSVLFEEVGELAEAVRKREIESIGEELCDVLFMVLSLSNYFGVEIEDKLIEKYLLRDPSVDWDLEQ